MSTVTLLHDDLDGCYVETRHAGLRDVLATRLHTVALDRQLAAGVSPDTSVRLSLRARALSRAGTRTALGRRLHQIVLEPRRPSSPYSSALQLCWHKIALARPEILELADRLLDPSAVAVPGIARTRLLLCEGDSPFYSRPAADDLAVAAQSALLALEPWAQETDENSWLLG